MKKLFFFLLFLSILFSSIQKPWDYAYWANENGNIIIFGPFEIWNTNGMHSSLESLELEKIAVKNEQIIKLKENYSLAVQSKIECDYIGERAFSLEMITNPLFIISDLSYHQISQKTITKCLNYPLYWRSVMGLATDYIFNMEKELESGCILASNAYFELEFSGTCSYSPSMCEDLYAINSNCKKIHYQSDYEDIYFLLKYIDKTNSEIKKPVPDMGGFSNFSNFLDLEILDKISAESKEASNILDLMENEYYLLQNTAQSNKKKVLEKCNNLEKQKISLIFGGSQIDGYISNEISDFSEEFEDIQDERSILDLDFDLASITFRSKTRNYLKISIEGLEDVNSRYKIILEKAQMLEDNAIELSNLKREEAKKAINNFEKDHNLDFLDSVSQSYLKDAKENFQKGEDAITYGEKYSYYRNAVSFINAINENGKDGELELLFFSKLSVLKELIENSKKDEIDVSYEQTVASYLEKYPNEKMIFEIESLSQRIIEKLKLRYGYLEEKRRVIKEKALLIQNENGYLFSFLNEKETGIFEKDKINYMLSAGRLKSLESAYFEIEEELNYEIEKTLPNNLIKEMRTFVSNCTFAEKCNVIIEIMAQNPYAIQLKKTEIQFSLPLEMMLYKNDIIYGQEKIEEIAVENSKLTIFLKEINASSYAYIIINKNETIAQIKKFTFNSIGNTDKTASFSYNFDIVLFIDTENMQLPNYSGGLKSVKLDGIDINTNNGFINEIKKGNHNLQIESFSNDAYSIEKTQIQLSNIGLNKKIAYTLEITANEQLSTTPIILYDGISAKISSLNIFSSSGHQIKNKKAGEFGEIYFDISDIKKDEKAKIKVEYLILDPTGYIDEEIEKLELNDLSQKDLNLIEEIKEEAQKNNTDLAIKKIKELEAQIETEKNEEYKLSLNFNDEKLRIENEISVLEGLLKNIDENDSLFQRFYARKAFLESILSKNPSPSQASLDALLETDDSWLEKEAKQSVKDLYSHYNLIKKDLISLGLYDSSKDSIAEIENMLNTMEVQKDLEYYSLISRKIGILEDLIKSENEILTKDLSEKKKELVQLIDSIEEPLLVYELQFDDSKESEFEYLFSSTPKEIRARIEEFSKQIDKYSKKDLELKITSLSADLENINSINDYLKRESQARLSDIFLVCQSENKDVNICSKTDYISNAKSMIDEKRYAKAIIIINSIFSNETEKKDDNVILLGITLVLIVSLLVYLLKDHIKFPQFKKQEQKKLPKHGE